ncbi:MAG: hypothetical protein NTW26_08430 [bacterium]|nr:hypothetical protein [bacterium]
MKAFVLSVSLGAVLVLGCADVTGSTELGAGFWPLAVGNSWTYRDSFGDLAEATVTAEEGGWYCWDEGVAQMALWCSDHSCRRQPAWPPPGDSRYTMILLEEPLEEGATWPLYADGSGEARLVKADFLYETPDGDWGHCYKVELGTTWEVYARGIGLVAEGFGDFETRHLVEYAFGDR